MLDNVSKERIMTEFVKMLSESDSHNLSHVFRCHDNVFFHIFKNIKFDFNVVTYNKVDPCTLWALVVRAISSTPNDVITRLAVIFEDVLSDSGIDEILKEYRFDNITIKNVKQLASRHELYYQLTGDVNNDAYLMRVVLHDIGTEQTFRLLNIWRANAKSKTNIGKYNRLRDIDIAQMLVEKVISEGQCFTLKDLDISGDDLIEIGYKPGKEVGYILNRLLHEVMREPFKNKKNWLLNWAKKELEENALEKQY